ncbi:hypothetical protein OQA88_2255 [Cercophora sp. LCS_1]
MPRGSSFSDTPLLKVSRPVSACSRCRSAKVKCDGKLPACTACEKAGRANECSAANDQFARGKERSYVAALELRIEKLSNRLEYAKLRKDSVAVKDIEALTSASDQSTRKDSYADIKAAIHRKAARKREQEDVELLVSDFGYMTINATTRDFDPSDMTFARFVLAAVTYAPIPQARTTLLPLKELAEELIQFYLTNIHPLYPIFPASHLSVLAEDIYEDTRPIKSADYWVFWVALAIGSAAQSRHAEDNHAQNGREFIARALDYADRALVPGYVNQLKALFLFTLYSLLDPTHFDSWHLIGFTCRAAIDLGYHHELPKSQPGEALEERRRLFYCIYSLDRTISMVWTRPFSLIDDALTTVLPAPNPPSQLQGVTRIPDPSSHLFKLRRLQSSWYQTLCQSDPHEPHPDPTSYKWKMCLGMREWSEGVPKNLPAGIRDILDLELRYSYVYCLAPSARAPELTPYGRTLIFEHAIAYIARMYDIVQGGRNTGFYTYHDALRVFFMGTQFHAALSGAVDALLAGPNMPGPMTGPSVAPPPPLPERFDRDEGGDNLDRSLRTLEKVSSLLRIYGDRWEDASHLMQSYDMIAGELLGELKSRREIRDGASNRGDHGPPLSQGVPSFPQSMHLEHIPQQQADVRWIDQDVAQQYLGGGGI